MEQGGNDGSEVCVSFYGFVKTVEEAKGLFLLAREGKCHLVKKRLTQGQKNTIAPGQIYIYDEANGEIQRWTDGRNWSNSSNPGDFLLYKELEVSYVDGKKIKKEKVNGMRKKTISDGSLRLVCYYQKDSHKSNNTSQTSPSENLTHTSSPSDQLGSESSSSISTDFDTNTSQNELDSYVQGDGINFENYDFPEFSLFEPNDQMLSTNGLKRTRLSSDDDWYSPTSPLLQTTPLLLQAPSHNAPIFEIHYPTSTAQVYLNGPNFIVEHSGGNADFAEYMEVVNEKEAKLMTPGSIVNLHEGRCTVNHFESPGCLPRIVSTQPLIVGNVQADSSTTVCIAMVGQVPVKVLGEVRKGQFIVAGIHFNSAKAVNGSQLTLESYSRVVGIALEDNNNPNLKLALCLIFYPDCSWLTRTISDQISHTNNKIDSLEHQFHEFRKELQQQPNYSSISKEETIQNKKKKRCWIIVIILLLLIAMVGVSLSIYYALSSNLPLGCIEVDADLNCDTELVGCDPQNQLLEITPDLLFLHSQKREMSPYQRYLSNRQSCEGNSCVVIPANDYDSVGVPHNPDTFLIEKLSGEYDPELEDTTINIWVQNTNITTCGTAVQVQILYDFNGDNDIDRVETFGYFPLACLYGFQKYQPLGDCGNGNTGHFCVSGSEYQPFKNGRVIFHIWSALGNPFKLGLRTDGLVGSCYVSYLKLPYIHIR